MKKKVTNFIGSNMGIAVGTIGIDKMGGNTAAMSSMSGMMPLVGNTMGMGMVMDQMKGMRRKIRR